MSDYFPPELIESILLKLPVESLIRFTSVSKSWRSIITSPSFISSHLYMPPQTSAIFFRRYYDYEDPQDYYSLAESKSFSTILSTKNFEIPLKWEVVDLKLVGSCRGVICLSDCGFTPSTHYIVLWNPRLRKNVVLPERIIANPIRSVSSVLGFGFADHDFKVVELVFCCQPKYLLEAHVFSLKRWTWRRLDFIAGMQNITDVGSPVYSNGVVCWLVGVRNYGHTILVFDVADEDFGGIELPNELAMEEHFRVGLSMSLIEESLAMIRYPNSYNGKPTEVWLLQEDSSWTRLYSFSSVQEGLWGTVVAVGNCSGEALVDSKDGLVAFDFMNSEIKNLGIQRASDILYIENYVESLELLGVGESDDGAKEEDLT